MSSLPDPRRADSLSGALASGVAVGLMLGLGAIAIVLAAVPSSLFDLDRFSVPKELALHLTALVVVLAIVPRRGAVELGIVEACLLGFAGWTALSALGADNRWVAIRAAGITFSGVALFFAARYAAIRGGRRVVIGGLAIAAFLGGLTGLAQSYGWSSAFLADTRAPGGTLGNRNFMAHLMVLGLPLAGWLLATARRAAGVLASLALSAFSIAAIVLSRSRAAWLGLAAMVAVVVVVGLLTRGPAIRLPRRRVIALGSSVGLGAAVALVLPNRLEWKSATPYRDSLRGVLNYREGSGRGRLIQYRNSLELARRHPVLGVGPGNWVVAYPAVTTPGDPSFNAADPMPTNPWPSSDWVALIAERGPFGALLWLATLGSLSIVALRRARNPDPRQGAAALAALGLVSALSVQGLFDAVTLLAPPTLMASVALGALLPPTRPIRAGGRDQSGRVRLAGVGGLLFVLLAAKSAAQLAAIKAAEPGHPLPRVARAARLDPGNYRLLFLLATREKCPAAARYANRLLELYPAHPWPKRLATRCVRSAGRRGEPAIRD